jgi:hypothetical protein
VTIAKAMNGDPAYAALSRRHFDGARPASPRKGTGSWAPSSVRAMLYNERYIGLVPFGEYRKTYRGGTKARARNADKDILRASRPDLRIVPDDLWRAVQERLAAAKKTYLRDMKGAKWSRPGMGIESKYLLSGFGECGVLRPEHHEARRPGGIAREARHPALLRLRVPRDTRPHDLRKRPPRPMEDADAS